MKKALACLEQAAQAGYCPAELDLGNCYDAGIGVERDSAKAVYWWRRAARQDSEEAHTLLSRAYAEGRGVRKNTALAAKHAAESERLKAGMDEDQCPF